MLPSGADSQRRLAVAHQQFLQAFDRFGRFFVLDFGGDLSQLVLGINADSEVGYARDLCLRSRHLLELFVHEYDRWDTTLGEVDTVAHGAGCA